jgi:hypothetical protein
MAADSDSRIAWHRAQLSKHRETLRHLETARFTVGEIAGSRPAGQKQKSIADLERKIGQSQQVITAYERKMLRPRATDYRSLASAPWSKWNALTVSDTNSPAFAGQIAGRTSPGVGEDKAPGYSAARRCGLSI